MDLRLNNKCRTQQTEDRLRSGKETEYKGTQGTVYAVPCPTTGCDVYLSTPIDGTLIPDRPLSTHQFFRSS
ncbi:hypothetical protein [Flagellimonas okinawensis]|uniref:Uncharacterized protein n=1 Tax=Flagellimonas okinawensis TaxID=3031324 RepID=A0ABT5XK40_9FLAO|nr:hypothetical protein [[Muricauda] okinawensis]MDF0706254.1 hypothetical protein [[Muricauda] okinawensis]